MAEHEDALAARQRQHDAANWLAVLRGHLDLLALEPDATPELRADRLRRARAAAAAAERLLRGPRAVSDVVAPRPLVAVLADFAPHVPPLLPARARFALDVELPPDLCAVLDEDDLADVLINLLRNAGQALGDPPGAVTVRARTAPEGVEIAVEDEGSGMTREVRERCLDPGFSTRPGAGRGLGLARVRDLVAAVQGRIEIDSELGRGTVVRLQLAAFRTAAGADSGSPVGVDASADARPDATATGTDAASVGTYPGAQVLVVDDDPDVLAVLEALLSRLGASVRTASDAEGMRAGLRVSQPDVVILDRELGATRGDALVAEVRQSAPASAIVLLTGDAAGARAQEPFDRAVLKPVGLAGLRALLDEMLPLSRRRRAELDDA